MKMREDIRPVTYLKSKAAKTAVGLMKLLVQGEEDVRLGKTYDQDELFQSLTKRLLGRKTARAKKAKI